MTGYLERMNLRPNEQRLVVGVAVVVFVVLNLLLVWPHRGDATMLRNEIARAQKTLDNYQKTIKAVPGYQTELQKLEGDGANVVADEQDIQLLRTVQTHVAESKITVNSYSAITRSATGQTNEFFEEQSLRINISTGEKELVDFLLNVGTSSSMIRVRELNLQPADQARYKLQGNVTLVANYQKKTAAKLAPPAPKLAPPAAKPTTTAPKPASTAKPVSPPPQQSQPAPNAPAKSGTTRKTP
jgi:hypothetical protein